MKESDTKCYTSVDIGKVIAGGQDMLSPYHAMGNNPVSMADPGGMMPPGGPIGFKNPNIIPFLSPAGTGIGSPTNGYYTQGINLANFSSIGQWINTFGDGEKALSEAFGQAATDNFDATTGNNSDNTSKVAGNYSSGSDGSSGAEDGKGNGDDSKGTVVGHKGDGKGNDFRGGKKSDRDQDMGKYPTAFRRWYHQNKKDYVLPNQSDPDLAPIYEEWKDLGSPSAIVSPQLYYPIFQHMYDNANYSVPDLPGMDMMNGANAIMRGTAIFWDNVMQTILPNSQSTAAPVVLPIGASSWAW